LAGLVSIIGWAEPTGPAFGQADDRLRVPTKSCGAVGTARKSAPLPTLQVIPSTEIRPSCPE